ncbi:MAG: PorT family protein [Tannerella sp.]|jgi:hypothetical protein|nr:PorT family protein [Tannerella sp.]
MKLKTYVILCFTLMASTAGAQIIITTPYEFSVGISGGTTFSSVSFSPRVEQSTLPGMTFGLTGRMTMGEYVGLQLEINYAQQGWNEFFEITDNSTETETETEKVESDDKYTRRLNYLQLPFYTHVQFGGKNVKGFINAGPQIGYFISESTDENLKERGRQPAMQHDMPVEKKFEWGISGGAGIEFRTGIGYFLLEGRYYYSFGDIYSTKVKDNFSKASSQIISAKISYLIPF